MVAELLGGELEAGDRVGGLQQFDLLLGGQEGRVTGVVGKGGDVVDGLHPVDDLPGAALAQPGGGEGLVLLDEFGDVTGQRFGDGLVDRGPLDPQGGARAGGPRTDLHPAAAADERARVAVGQPADLLDGAEHTGAGVLAVDAWHQKNLRLSGFRAGGGLGGLHRGADVGVVQVQRNHHSGQHDLVVERQHGQGERCGRRSHDLPLGSQVELCRLNAQGASNVPHPLACSLSAITAAGIGGSGPMVIQ